MKKENNARQTSAEQSSSSLPLDTVSVLKSEIIRRSNIRKRKNVEGLLQVLYEMRRKGESVFNIAKVGAACEAAGIMKTQSLRNTGGADFRALIDAFASNVCVSRADEEKIDKTPIEQAINGISSLDVRTRLNIILAENRRQREEISRLKQAFGYLRSESPAIRKTIVEDELPHSLNYCVKRAPLKKFLSQDWLEERGWIIRSNGSIWDEDESLMVAPVGFVDALAEMLK